MALIPYEDFQIEPSVLNRLKEAYAERKISEYFKQHGTLPDDATIQKFYDVPEDLIERYKKYFYSQYVAGENPHKGNSVVSFTFSFQDEQRGLSYGVPPLNENIGQIDCILHMYEPISKAENIYENTWVDVHHLSDEEHVIRNGTYNIDYSLLREKFDSGVSLSSFFAKIPQGRSVPEQVINIHDDNQIIDIKFNESDTSLIISNKPFDIEFGYWPESGEEVSGTVSCYKANDYCYYIYMYDWFYNWYPRPNERDVWYGTLSFIKILSEQKKINVPTNNSMTYLYINSGETGYCEINERRNPLDFFFIESQSTNNYFNINFNTRHETWALADDTVMFAYIFSLSDEIAIDYENGVKPDWINNIDIQQTVNENVFIMQVYVETNESGVTRETTVTLRNKNNTEIPIDVRQFYMKRSAAL